MMKQALSLSLLSGAGPSRGGADVLPKVYGCFTKGVWVFCCGMYGCCWLCGSGWGANGFVVNPNVATTFGRHGCHEASIDTPNNTYDGLRDKSDGKLQILTVKLTLGVENVVSLAALITASHQVGINVPQLE